jgi:alpha-ketoglutarate-dependent taurine dioxygenase
VAALVIDLPASAVVELDEPRAHDLAQAVAALPAHDEDALLDRGLQASLRSELRRRTPAYDDVAHEILVRLRRPPYAACLRGASFDSEHRLLVALSSSFGDVVEPYRQPWSRVVHRVVPVRDEHGSGVLNEKLHTDGTDWPRQNDLTCLLCVRPDANGDGRSRLLDLDALVSHLRRVAPDVLETLDGHPLPWAVAPALGGGVHREPALGAGTLRWLRYTVEVAVEQGEHVDPEVAEALVRLEHLVEEADGVMEFWLDVDDFLVVSNRRCLHARSAIGDPDGSGRLLLRTKVQRAVRPAGDQLVEY